MELPASQFNGVTLGEPLVEFSGITVVPAAGAPHPGAEFPARTSLAGDTGKRLVSGQYLHQGVSQGLPLRLHKPANLQHSGGEDSVYLTEHVWRRGVGGSGYNTAGGPIVNGTVTWNSP